MAINFILVICHSVTEIVEEFRRKSKLQLRCFNVTVSDDSEAV